MSIQIVTRADFQVLAEQRIAEAKALLDQALWHGAYYLAGYAVELGLKACIIKRLLTTDKFPEREFSKECYTHTVEKLVRLAKLDGAIKNATHADPDLEANWGVAKDWSEQKRYHTIAQAEAVDLYQAITDNAHGVLPWIKTQW